MAGIRNYRELARWRGGHGRQHPAGIARHGATIAIDAFGTSYSPLSYLARVSIDRLKIDRSFIHSSTTDHLSA
ncbi:EAL domain-containing protein [Acidovorax sp.]|uniref:EAL domain-containing protein n=1 Tax=Acidovorax sp. TaxID=1872122 RepID=UPI0031D41A12